MKQYLVILVSLTLIVNSNCGFLDSVLGTVSNTAHSITHGVGDVVHRGKNFVFGGTEQNAAGQDVIKPGIVGTISHKIHDVSSNVREEFRALIHLFDGDQVHGKGVIGRLFDRVKCRVFKIKSFLSGNAYIEPAQNGHAQIGNRPHVPFRPPKNDTRVLSEKLRKYFFNKDSPATSGIRQTINSLHEVIDRIRFNATRKRQESGNENSEYDGTGMIDIRTSANNLGGGLEKDFNNGVDAAYDKVDETIDEGRQSAQSSFNRAQHNTNEFLENQRRNVQKHYNQFGDNVDRIRSDVGQSINNNIEHQRRNVQRQYNQMASNADRFRSDIGQSVTDNIEYQRRNVQNHYNQFGENADRFRSDVGQSINDNTENHRRNVQYHYNQFGENADTFRSDGQSINDNIENQRRNVQNHYNEMANNADSLRSDVVQSVTENIDYQRRNVQNQYANNADRIRSDVGQSFGKNRRILQSHYNQFNNNADRFGSDVSQSVTDNIENQRRNVQNHYNVMANNADKLRSDIGTSISDIEVRLEDESSRVTDQVQNAYSKVDADSQKLGVGY